jgi:hypothetical protein
VKIWEIVHSSEGIEAMKKAVADGWPPLSGVDPILHQTLGADYGAHNLATATAGDFVVKEMRRLGYKDTGKSGKLPDHCKAKTGRVFQS